MLTKGHLIPQSCSFGKKNGPESKSVGPFSIDIIPTISLVRLKICPALTSSVTAGGDIEGRRQFKRTL